MEYRITGYFRRSFIFEYFEERHSFESKSRIDKLCFVAGSAHRESVNLLALISITY